MSDLPFESLPLGFRFKPTDQELIDHYLRLKINGHEKEVSVIREVDVCKVEPWDLPDFSNIKTTDPEWFFFCPRDQKYPNGQRSNRATSAGYWKATGKDRKIVCRKMGLIGMKKTLVFYMGRAPSGKRTHWVIHEYRTTLKELDGTLPGQGAFVISRLFKKPDDKKQEDSDEGYNCNEGETLAASPTATNLSMEYLPSELASVKESPTSMAVGEDGVVEVSDRAMSYDLVSAECSNSCNVGGSEVQVEEETHEVDSHLDEDLKYFYDPQEPPSPLNLVTCDLLSAETEVLPLATGYASGYSGIQFQNDICEKDAISDFLKSIIVDPADFPCEDFESPAAAAFAESPTRNVYIKEKGSCNGSDVEVTESQHDLTFAGHGSTCNLGDDWREILHSTENPALTDDDIFSEAALAQFCNLPNGFQEADSLQANFNEKSESRIKIRTHPRHNEPKAPNIASQGTARRRIRLQSRIAVQGQGPVIELRDTKVDDSSGEKSFGLSVFMLRVAMAAVLFVVFVALYGRITTLFSDLRLGFEAPVLLIHDVTYVHRKKNTSDIFRKKRARGRERVRLIGQSLRVPPFVFPISGVLPVYSIIFRRLKLKKQDMALGSCRVGGSSSSNLSALAPPFTVHKPFSKPNSSNPPLNFSEFPHVASFNPSIQIRQHPFCSTSGPNFTEAEPVLATSGLPSASVYGYVDSLANNSTGTQFPSLNQAPVAAFDPFSYDQYTSGMGMHTTFPESTPYYSPYQVHQNGYSLAGCDKPGYDFLSNPGCAAQTGGLSQVDYSGSVSHLEYTPPWSGFWNGMTDGNSGSQDYRPSGSCACKSYADQVEGPGSGSYIAKYLSGSSGLEGGKSFFEPHPRITSSDCSTTCSFGSTSGCKGSQLQEPVREFIKNSGVYQNPYSTSSEKCTDHTNSYLLDFTPAAKPTLITVVESPSVGKDTAVAKSDFVSSNVVGKSEDFAKFDSFNLESPHLPLVVDCQVGDIGRAHSCFAGSSSTRMADTLDLKPNDIDVLDQLLLPKSAPQALCDFEKPSDGPDIHNPAVDSPCWRGAPAARFSPFGASEAADPEVLVKKLELCHSLDKKGSDSPPLSTTEAVHAVFEKPNGNNSLGSSSGNEGMPLEKDFSGSTELRNCFSKMNGGYELQIEEGNNQPGKRFSLLNNSEPDFDLPVSFSTKLILKDGEFARERKLAQPEVAATEKSGKCTGTTTADKFSGIPFSAGEDLLSSPSVTSADRKLPGKDSYPIINLNMLVYTMKNLSEVLRYHCSNYPAAVRGQDHMALNHVINNLHACLPLMETEQIRPTENFTLPQQGMPPSHEEMQDPTLSARLGGAQERKLMDADMEWLEHKNLLKSKRHFALDIQNALSNSASAKDSADTDTLTQAVKGVLYENFPTKEVSDPEVMLYKNLWLEAEAALCSFTIKTRFQRMIRKTEKCGTRDKIQGGPENMQSSKVSPDVHRMTEHGSQAEVSLGLGIHGWKSLELSKINDDIPSAQMEKSKSTKIEGKQLPINRSSVDCRIEGISIDDLQGLSPDDLADDIEASVTARVQEILDCNVDDSAFVKTKGRESIAMERGAHKDPPDPYNAVSGCYFSSTIGYENIPEASVMARFDILKNRTKNSSSMAMITSRSGLGDGTQALDYCLQLGTPLKLSEHDDVKRVNLFAPGLTPTQSFKANCLGSGFLEGWYECPASSDR
ncbi:hypothetical protein Nepgr_020268 [Nepenthes gracilis]|uniref:NAC domain-containing protein n=1 Tax=Nepenthes gracilis TaxID=150966 RepID=A0AAD3SWR5_NEPGR|nr:hypothetical protein Nepgr_020268 [Nepenthes gracilis]